MLKNHWRWGTSLSIWVPSHSPNTTIRLQQGRLAQADQLSARALEISREDPDNHFHRAQIYIAQGLHSAAMPELEQTLQINPGNAGAYMLKARLLTRSGHGKQAIAALQKACDLQYQPACMTLGRMQEE